MWFGTSQREKERRNVFESMRKLFYQYYPRPDRKRAEIKAFIVELDKIEQKKRTGKNKESFDLACGKKEKMLILNEQFQFEKVYANATESDNIEKSMLTKLSIKIKMNIRTKKQYDFLLNIIILYQRLKEIRVFAKCLLCVLNEMFRGPMGGHPERGFSRERMLGRPLIFLRLASSPG